ncbi:hypothetical protein Tco_0150427 [Tanacetum coccineum]
MTSYNQRGCFKCGGPFGDLYCRQCTCERCRRNYTDEVCALCCYEFEKSFINDSNPNSFIDSPNIFNPPPQPQTYSCEFYGNNAHYGYDFPPQVPFIYNPELPRRINLLPWENYTTLVLDNYSLLLEDGTTRTKNYEELSVTEKLQADCDLKATNIVLQGLPPDVYAIFNHHKVAKVI